MGRKDKISSEVKIEFLAGHSTSGLRNTRQRAPKDFMCKSGTRSIRNG